MKSLTLLSLLLLCLSAAFGAEEPYRIADLQAMREPDPQTVRAALRTARAAIGNRRPPAGKELVYYAAGLGGLDEWYSVTTRLFDSPPRVPSYFRLVYRGGHLVSIYANKEGTERLSSFICYDDRGFPVASVLHDAKGKTLRLSVLTFDKQDRIKRVLVLDGEDRATRMTCFLHLQPGYAETESWDFSQTDAWKLGRRTANRGGEVFSFNEGEWERLPTYSRLGYSQALVEFGLARLYPGDFSSKPLPLNRVPRIRLNPPLRGEGRAEAGD